MTIHYRYRLLSTYYVYIACVSVACSTESWEGQTKQSNSADALQEKGTPSSLIFLPTPFRKTCQQYYNFIRSSKHRNCVSSKKEHYVALRTLFLISVQAQKQHPISQHTTQTSFYTAFLVATSHLSLVFVLLLLFCQPGYLLLCVFMHMCVFRL